MNDHNKQQNWEKCDLCGSFMVTGARHSVLRISETADPLIFSCTTYSIENGEGKTSSEQQFCRKKCLADTQNGQTGLSW